MGEKKNRLIEIWDWATDIASVSTPLLNALGIPVTPLSIVGIGKTIKLFSKMGVTGVIKDFRNRQISSMQQDKLNDITSCAIKTIYQLIEKDGWEDIHPESSMYTQYFIEYSEDMINKALNESRKNKRLFLGAYLGSTLYALNNSSPNWENVFYLSSLIDRLTLRQIILVKLIVDNFKCIEDHNEFLCVTNKVAISEIKDLLSLNLWVELFSQQPNPTHIAIPLKYMCPTDLSKELFSSALVPNTIQDVVDETVASLDLKPYSQSGLPNPFREVLEKQL